jgi:multiple sugar transport system ATP-binding protein
MSSLTINSVGKRYGEVRAIKDISIQVEDGEFLVLVGPSGCGKSTLLRMIAGLEQLTEGQIRLGERDVSRVDPKDRDVAMVFQNYALYPHMTVFENMAFGLQQRKVAKEQIKKLVMEAAHILELVPLINRKPGALSGGQRQRVAMGRAIVRSPAIYLMDEPLSNLDAKLRVQMRAELKLLRKRLGVTTVYVTHDQIEAMTLGDRVAVLSPYVDGQTTNLEQCDSPQKLYLQPRNMFVAGFIGSPAMNFLYVDLEKEGDALTAHVADTNILFTLSPDNTPVFDHLVGYAGQRVVMGIRPEFFSCTQQASQSRHQELAVDVTVSELVGPDAYLHFDLTTPPVASDLMTVLNDGEMGATADARFTARVESEGLGDDIGRVLLYVDIPRMHYFDFQTSRRIGHQTPSEA